MSILYKNVHVNVDASGLRYNLFIYAQKGTKGKPTSKTSVFQLHSHSYTQFTYQLISL